MDRYKNNIGYYYSSLWSREYCQLEDNDCGVCCIAYLVRRTTGQKPSLAQMKSRASYDGRPLNLKEMIQFAQVVGLEAVPYKNNSDASMGDIDLPAIVHLKNNHYVVIFSKIGKNLFEVFDPSRGVYKSDIRDVEVKMSGYYLEVSRVNQENIPQLTNGFGLKNIYNEIEKHRKTIIVLGIISMIFQFVSLAPIVITQKIIDSINNPGSERTIIFMLFLSALILSLDFLLTGMRGVILNQLRVNLSFDSAGTTFGKIWQASSGKVSTVSTAKLIKDFDEIHVLRDILSIEIISFVLSASSVFISLCFLIYYHPTAALISLLGAVAYVIVKLLSIPKFVFLESEAHIANANLHGTLYETLDQFSSIVSHPLGDSRRSFLWAAYGKKISNEWMEGTFSLKFTLLSIFVFGLVTVVAHTICFSSVILGEISLGAAFAFFALQQRFISSGSQFINGIQSLSIFRISLDRLFSFEALEKSIRKLMWEPNLSLVDPYEIVISEYPLISDKTVSDVIRPGEFILIAGGSGTGKSTFLKSLAKSISSTSEHFRFQWNSSVFGSAPPIFCMVGQSDSLLSGTLEENITFFSSNVDSKLLAECVEICGVDKVLEKLTYGISTPITFSAAPISGGEYQRVLLARALYSKPDILVIDEATSDLDVPAEIDLLVRIQNRVGVLIVVSHKSEIHSIGTKTINLH